MKQTIRTPYFEIGTKNYIYGDTVLEYALAADKAAEKYDIDVLFICPAVEIRRVAESITALSGKILGVIMTDVAEDTSLFAGKYGRYGRYGRYGKYGKYGDYVDDATQPVSYASTTKAK